MGIFFRDFVGRFFFACNSVRQISLWQLSDFGRSISTDFTEPLCRFQSSWLSFSLAEIYDDFPLKICTEFQVKVATLCSSTCLCGSEWGMMVLCSLKVYTGCPRRNGQNFGIVFLMLNYTDISQNTYIQSWKVTKIMAREVWNFDSCYTLIDYQIHIKTGRDMWFL